MFKIKLFQISLLLLFSRFWSICESYSIILDSAPDIGRYWKIKGDYLFCPKIQCVELSVGDQLGPDYKRELLNGANGIWLLAPSENSSSRNINMTQSLTIGYQLGAHLFAEVNIRFCLRGEGKILLKRNSQPNEEPFYTISASSPFTFEWITLDVPINNYSSEFLLEAEINGNSKEDLVLIDKIKLATYESPPRPYKNRTGKTRGSTMPIEMTTISPQKAIAVDNGHFIKIKFTLFAVFLSLIFFT